MMKKKFGFVLQFLAVVLALIGVMSFCGELRPVESIAEESAYEEELKYPITETDVHNGMNVANYAKYYGEKMDITEDQTTYYTVHGDDAIVNFIPRELRICVKTQEKMSHISERVNGNDIGHCKRRG